MYGLRLSGIKYHINNLSGKICQLCKKSGLVLVIHFLIHLLHIDTFCTKDFSLDLFFVFVKNLDTYLLICHCPSADT